MQIASKLTIIGAILSRDTTDQHGGGKGRQGEAKAERWTPRTLVTLVMTEVGVGLVASHLVHRPGMRWFSIRSICERRCNACVLVYGLIHTLQCSRTWQQFIVFCREEQGKNRGRPRSHEK